MESEAGEVEPQLQPVVLLEGRLEKLSPRKKMPLGGQRWQTRHFVLTPTQLHYHKPGAFKKKPRTASPSSPHPSGEPQGTIELAEVACARLQPSAKNDALFQVVMAGEGGRVFTLAADSAKSARRWVDAITAAMVALASSPSTIASCSSASALLVSASSYSATKPISKKVSSSRRGTTGTQGTSASQRKDLLAGEKILYTFSSGEESVYYTHHMMRDCQEATLVVTNYRFIFVTKNHSESVPLGLVMKFSPVKHDTRNTQGFALKCKDFRSLMIFCEQTESYKTLSSLLKKRLCPARIGDLFAYQSQESFDKAVEIRCRGRLGLCLYDVGEEFKRQQVPPKKWRITNVNSSFPSSANPSHFVVPFDFSDETIIKCWKFKHEWQQLVASLCWYNPETEASLLRGLPPLLIEEGSTAGLFDAEFVSVMSKQKVEAGKPLYLIEHVAATNPRIEEVHLFNTSSKKKITSPTVALFEDAAHESKNVKMRCPLGKMVVEREIPLLPPAAVEESLLELAAHISSFDAFKFMTDQKAAGEWRRAIADTKWLTGIRGLIMSTAKVVAQLQVGNPVVVTGEEGVGAIPQIVSLAQLCVDPYFRTIEGFCLLIEKEWMAVAHEWGQSNKHKYLVKQYSPVFVQFIDAAWQIWMQWHEHFEFTADFLIFLLDSVYSCRFGSFLANNQYDRTKGRMNLCKLPSVWAYAITNRKQFINPSYVRPSESKHAPKLVLHQAQVSLWGDYYLRWVTATAESPDERIASRTKASTEGDWQRLDSLALLSVPVKHVGSQVSSLSVTNNLISNVGNCITHLPNLTSLDVSHNLLTTWAINTLNYDASNMTQLVQLHTLDLSHNLLWCIELLPASVQVLNVSNNRLGQLPRGLSSLTNLRSLNIAHNNLINEHREKALPGVLLQLSSLTVLNVSGNMLEQMPGDFFSSMLLLEELNLSRNNLGVLPRGISHCSRLRILNLSDNPLTSLPRDLSALSALQELYLSKCFTGHNEIKNTGKGKGGDRLRLIDLALLCNLRCLDLSDNEIEFFPMGFFAQWSNMQNLWLSRNQLTLFPTEIVCLAMSLKELDIGHNKIDVLPAEIAKLTQLERLSMENNQITELPVQLGTMTQLTHLEVRDQKNHLRSPPPEVMVRGLQSIIGYLGQLLKGQEPCNRLKLMFVGQENVGKTSLLLSLQRACGHKPSHPEYRSDGAGAEAQLLSTDGIDITKWSLSTATGHVDLSAWDFAGQEIYYSTHEFFLSERSLFLVIFNLLSPAQSRMEYWLQSIHLATKDSPVLIIGTHAEDEQCNSEFLDQIRQSLRPLKKRYSNIVGVHFVSCSTGLNIDELIDAIQSVISTQKHVGQMLPSSYLALEQLAMTQARIRTPPVLSWPEYSELAKLCMIDDASDGLNTATALLHTLGSLVHFSKEDKLRDMVILEPQWLMDVMATVLSTKHNYCREGVLRQGDLPQIWRPPNYPPEMHDYLLSLLERFEVVFPMQGHSRTNLGNDADVEEKPILVPSLLPTAHPQHIIPSVWTSVLAKRQRVFGRYYQFQFVPKGFMGRLLIRLLAFPITAQAMWRYGMLCSFVKESILVELDPEENQLKVIVKTESRGEQMSNVCWLIFAAVDSLIQEWYNLNAHIFVPCPHCMSLCQTMKPHLFTLRECQEAAITPSKAILSCPLLEHSDREGGQLIRLDNAAPDLAMVHLDRHKLEFTELKKEDDPIGEGGFAFVYRGTYRGQDVAIKLLKSGSVSDDSLKEGHSNQLSSDRLAVFEEFRHEVWIMSGLAHPNLVAMVGFCAEPACIVTEFIAGGSLQHYLRDLSKPLNWPLRLKIAKDIAKGCAFLHGISPPVMHRDLKSPNILLADVSPGAEVVAKVCDFGVSLNAVFQAHGRRVDCPVWLAPEVIEQKPYTEKADVYSIGVILWELLTRKSFFGEVRFMSQIEDAVLAGQRPPIPDDCVGSYRSLIEDCWAGDPEKRPSCADIVRRVEELMRELCPDVINYDQDVERKHREKREAERALQIQPEPERAWEAADKRTRGDKSDKLKRIKDIARQPLLREDVCQMMREFKELHVSTY